MKQLSLLLFGFMVIAACRNSVKEKQIHPDSVVNKPVIAVVKNKFPGIVFSAKKDLACGMPLTAGIEDTAHYKGKIYGFCSKECKEDFLKKPESFIILTDRIN